MGLLPRRSAGFRRTVLVVGNDGGVREAIGRVLADGYDLRGAADGTAALRALSVDPVDLLILDMQLRDVDGLRILQAVKSSSPHLPVIIVTPVTTVSAAVTAMKYGASDYITEPFRDGDLLAAVQAALDPTPANRPAPEAATPRRLVLLGDHIGRRASLTVLLGRRATVESMPSVEAVFSRLPRPAPACVVLDVRTLHAPGSAILRALRDRSPRSPIIVVGPAPDADMMREQPDDGGGPVIYSTASLTDLLPRVWAFLGVEDGSPPGSRHVLEAVDYISLHFNEEITTEHVAAAAGVSVSRVAHLFPSETGMTIRRYLTSVRIEIAKELLATTKDKLAKIAVEVGFCDASHLSRMFRRLAGCSPGGYRRLRSSPS